MTVGEFPEVVERDINPDDLETIETDTCRVEFGVKEQGPFGWIGTWDRARILESDDENIIRELSHNVTESNLFTRRAKSLWSCRLI